MSSDESPWLLLLANKASTWSKIENKVTKCIWSHSNANWAKFIWHFFFLFFTCLWVIWAHITSKPSSDYVWNVCQVSSKLVVWFVRKIFSQNRQTFVVLYIGYHQYLIIHHIIFIEDHFLRKLRVLNT